jgi:zinc protease
MMHFTGRGFSPSRVVISASGRFDRARLLDSLSSLLTGLDKLKNNPKNPVPDFPGPLPPGIFIFDKEATQASIRVGFPCVRRPHPDYYPLSVANYIFGAGGFTSRLVAKVRTEAGLAYSVRSFVASDYHRPGTAGFFLQSKVESGVEALSLCFAEMRKLADSGVTGEELTAAKDGLIKSLPSLFDTPAAVADIFTQSELWNRDLDHFKKYPEIINDMTSEKLLTAFRKYFIADSARIIIVGPKDKLLAGKLEDELARLGKITFLTAPELEKKPRK